MRNLMLIRALACAAALAAAAPASAQIFRAYLALDGVDTNPCTLTLPCRLLPAAHAAVADGGEVWILDSANYNVGPVTLSKSVTILAVPGALGSLITNSGPVITIATPGVAVTLRNLNLLPLVGSAGTGVDMTDGARLTVQGCNFSGFPSQPAILARTAAQVTVLDSVFRDNYWGVYAENGATVRIARSRFTGGNTAIDIRGNVDGLTTSATVSETISGGAPNGFMARSDNPGGIARLYISDSAIDAPSQGVLAFAAAPSSAHVTLAGSLVTGAILGVRGEGSGAVVRASGNTVMGNGTGFSAVTSATFESAGNNSVRANGTDLSGPITNVGTI